MDETGDDLDDGDDDDDDNDDDDDDDDDGDEDKNVHFSSLGNQLLRQVVGNLI